MFQIGQQVVYPVHGAGIIEDIETKLILGEERKYYSLHLSTGDLRVLIPVDTAEDSGLRPVSEKEKIAEVEEVLAGAGGKWEENWNRRYRLNMDKIKSGDICALAEVIRSLAQRDEKKGLSAGEKKMLDNAKRILLSEVVLSLPTDYEAARERMEHFIQKGIMGV